MKSLAQYLIEKEGDLNTGFWEPFTDEETGEVFNIWRSYPPKEIIQLQKEIDDEEIKIYDTIKAKTDELDKKYDGIWTKERDIRNEISGYEDDIRQLKYRRKELLSDMEQEVGDLMHNNKDAEAEKKGNEYGSELNDIEEEMDKLLDKISSLENELDKVLDESDKYDKESEAIDMEEEKLKSKLNTKKKKLEKLTKEFYEKEARGEV